MPFYLHSIGLSCAASQLLLSGLLQGGGHPPSAPSHCFSYTSFHKRAINKMHPCGNQVPAYPIGSAAEPERCTTTDTRESSDSYLGWGCNTNPQILCWTLVSGLTGFCALTLHTYATPAPLSSSLCYYIRTA